MANRFARAARALVGCRFRPQGRDPASGLDCIGLVGSAFAIPAERIPHDYRLRGDHRAALEGGLMVHFRRARTAREGDVLLLSVAPGQLHLGIKTDAGFVHAHAGLKRVVETPGEPQWPILAAFRRRAS